MEPKAEKGTVEPEDLGRRKGVAKEIADRIDTALIRKEMNRSQLAARLNKTDSWMSQVMSGKITLTIPLLYQIADVLGVDARTLLPGANPGVIAGGETATEFIRQLVRDEVSRDPSVLFCSTCPLRKTRPNKKPAPQSR